MTKKYMFNLNDVIAHIQFKMKHPTPIKIQKLLYFSWAYYTASYGNIDYTESSEFELQEKYPLYLFDAKFNAIKTGPIIQSVLDEMKSDNFSQINHQLISDNNNEREIIKFIDDLIKQIDIVNDFGVINRSKYDSAWKNAYNKGFGTEMNLENIKDDYIDYLERQKIFQAKNNLYD